MSRESVLCESVWSQSHPRRQSRFLICLTGAGEHQSYAAQPRRIQSQSPSGFCPLAPFLRLRSLPGTYPPIEGTVRAELEGGRASQPPGELRPSAPWTTSTCRPQTAETDAPRRPWLSFGAPDAPIYGDHKPTRAASTRTRLSRHGGPRRVGRPVRVGNTEIESLAGYSHDTTRTAPRSRRARGQRLQASSLALRLEGRNGQDKRPKAVECGVCSQNSISPSYPEWRNRHVSIPSGARAESLTASF